MEEKYQKLFTAIGMFLKVLFGIYIVFALVYYSNKGDVANTIFWAAIYLGNEIRENKQL